MKQRHLVKLPREFSKLRPIPPNEAEVLAVDVLDLTKEVPFFGVVGCEHNRASNQPIPAIGFICLGIGGSGWLFGYIRRRLAGGVDGAGSVPAIASSLL